jgi:hypothetical protein
MRLPSLLLALAAGAQFAGPALAETAAATPLPQPGEAEYTPEGAPHDDYNFTAWCEGVLEGHMALAEHVKSVLPLDEVQQKIGKAYLAGYEEALRIGRKGRSEAELDAAQAVRYAARANWNTAMQADLHLGADTYLAWQLPGRCEHAAKRIAKRDDIFKLAPSDADVEAMGHHASVIDDAPAPTAAPEVFTSEAAVAEVVANTPDPAPTTQVPELAPIADVSLTGQTSDLALDEAAMTTTDSEPADAIAEPAAGTATDSTPAEDAATEEADSAEAPAPAATPAPDAAQASASPARRMPSHGRLLPWGKRE